MPDASTELDRIRRAVGRELAAAESVREAVIDARAAGASWSQIGRALGVTAQAAHLRFARFTD